eukprot:328325-Chlamydomonas_euryale.AAC.6
MHAAAPCGGGEASEGRQAALMRRPKVAIQRGAPLQGTATGMVACRGTTPQPVHAQRSRAGTRRPRGVYVRPGPGTAAAPSVLAGSRFILRHGHADGRRGEQERFIIHRG